MVRKQKSTGIKVSQTEDYNEYHRRYYHLRVKKQKRKKKR